MAYALKRRWRDGTTHVVLRPEVLLERLLALGRARPQGARQVPRPRRHLVTYHGILAPAAGLRARVVPRWEEEDDGAEEVRVGAAADAESVAASRSIAALHRRRRWRVPHASAPRRRGGVRRYGWAELLRRVFEIDVLVCPHCGGARRLLAAIHDPVAIERVLRAMGLPHEAPVQAPARAPPGEDGWWGA